MATDTLEIFGTEYTGVTGIKATDDQSGTKTYIRPQGTKSISANGTGIDVAEYAFVDVNVSGGGGGASNVVTGTFKGTTTGAAIEVSLNYSGNGYPIAAVFYPNEGAYKSGGTFYDLVKRYATSVYTMAKSDPTLTPTYSGGASSDNAMYIVNNYKNSTSSATSRGNAGGNQTDALGGANSSLGQLSIVRFKAKNKISVFIQNTSYGFAANIEYKYWIIYSS